MNFLTAKSGSFLKFCNFLQVFKLFFFDLFTNKARNLKFAESDQAKASLTKLSKPTARRSFESIRPTLVGYVFVFSAEMRVLVVPSIVSSKEQNPKTMRKNESYPKMSHNLKFFLAF